MHQSTYEYVEGIIGVLVEPRAGFNEYVAYKQEFIQLGQAVLIVCRLTHTTIKLIYSTLHKTVSPESV